MDSVNKWILPETIRTIGNFLQFFFRTFGNQKSPLWPHYEFTIKVPFLNVRNILKYSERSETENRHYSPIQISL